MLSGLWFLICLLLITGPALLIVGSTIAIKWPGCLTEAPREVAPSLVALIVALLPDLVMLVNLFTGFRLIPVISNSDNVLLFSTWQIISGILIALALYLSLSEKTDVSKATRRLSLILLFIHGAGTALFFLPWQPPGTSTDRATPMNVESFSELLQVLYSAPLQQELWQRF